MRWLLVWWIIAPGHVQTVHYRDFESEHACMQYAALLPADKPIRAHCSVQ